MDLTDRPLWRLGNCNPNNVYVGDVHAGLLLDTNLAAQVVATMNGDPGRDERLRAEGRREADNAITWDTSCVGCADRLDRLYEERCAGADDVVRRIVADLRADYAETGVQQLLRAVDVALSHAARPAQIDAAPFTDPNGGTTLHPGVPG